MYDRLQMSETSIDRSLVGGSAANIALRLKLQAPKVLPHHIDRLGIAAILETAASVGVILFRAPPGFGKTTAMRQFQQRLIDAGRATSWLSVDRSDNDVGRFVAGLDAAVGVLLGSGKEREGSLSGDSSDMALGLLDRLARTEEPFSLFIDDVENIHNPAVFALIKELIEHLPRDGQLVIGSRTIPDIPLGRLRARGDLVEIEATQLRFSLAEATEFLGEKRRLGLSEDDILGLHAKTEGWVAAIWLASVALGSTEKASNFVARFTGSDKSVAEYLAQDVLARQSAEVQQFLLRTSILRQFDVHLCRRLLPNLPAERILADIVGTELLLVPLDDQHDSYRYHSLFGEFLEARLRAHPGEDPAQLHRLASRAFEDLGRPVPAIDHALAGDDQQTALRLLETHSLDLLAHGRMRLLSRWFATLPPQALRARPSLAVCSLWATCFAHGPWEVLDLLAQSELDNSEDTTITPHLRALRPTALAMMDRYEEAYEVGRSALRLVPTTVPFADHLLANTMATIATVVGEEVEARRLIETARRGQGNASSAFNRMYSEADDGILDFRAGRLRQAIARFRTALSTTHQSENQIRGNAFAGVPYAAAVYESGDLKRASHLIQVYLPLVRDIALPDHVILAYVVISRIAFARGDVDLAFQSLSDFEYLGHQRKISRVVASAKLERARLLLVQGHHRAAREELDRAEDDEVWQRVQRLSYLGNETETLTLGRLRWDIHAGNASSALVRVEPLLVRAIEGSRNLRAMKLHLLKALAHDRVGDSNAAFAEFAKTLRAACSEGFYRLVLDEGTPALQLLARYHEHRLTLDQYHAEPLLGEFVAHLTEGTGDSSAAVPPVSQAYDPGLTRKELRILELLADGYSNIAMSEKLFVSESTVRTHLRNINVKLGAGSRTQAVSVARKMGLLR